MTAPGALPPPAAPPARRVTRATRRAIEHQLDVADYGATLAAAVAADLLAGYRTAATTLPDLAPGATLTAAATAAVLRGTHAPLADAYATAAARVARELPELARLETLVARDLLVSAVPSLTVRLGTEAPLTAARAEALAGLSVAGAPLRQWWPKLESDAVWGIDRTLREGLARRESLAQLTQRLVTPSAAPDGGGVGGMAARAARTLVRTVVTATSVRAQHGVFRRLADVTSRWEFVATLDTRTTLTCASLDGTTWAYDDPAAPYPPLHPNCRSTTVPVIDWAGLGLPDPDGIVLTTRAAQGGPTTARRYETWLRAQPAAVQDEALGPARGRLFRQGLRLGQLVDAAHRPLTLAQLAARVEGTR